MSRAMKDSGIPWIGEMPEGWKVMPHKRVMRKVKAIQEHYNGENILSLTMRGVIVRDLDAGGKMPTTFDGYQKVYPNNLLQCLFDIDVTPRCVGLIKDEGLTSPAYSQFAMYSNGYAPYYDYLLRYMDDGKTLLHLSKNLRSSLTETDFGAIDTCVPPLAEQQRIAEFLDRKCAEVDEMIALQEQIIEELKAYKQSVITEAVTKGLNPAAPMRDSDIEWIGQIPEHWEVKRLKDVGYLYGGLTGKAGDDFIAEDDETCQYMRFIPYTNIFNNYLINPAQLYKVRIEEGEKQNLVNKGDILFLMSSEDYDGVGKPAMIDVQVDNLGLNSFCKGFRITDNSTYPKYLLYLLLSHTLREMVRQEGKGFIRINLRQDKLSTCPIILPDIVEQQAIADYLDDKCADIDSLIQTKQSKIDSLKEYKKSIIYEYVTGKREVNE